MKETLKHREAFELFYSLGDKRSCLQVGRKLAVSNNSVKKWHKAFNWEERVEQRDIENAKRLEEKTNETIVATKAKYRGIIKAVIEKLVQNLDNIVLNSTRDLECLIKLDLLLMGEATERQEGQSSLIIKYPDGTQKTWEEHLTTFGEHLKDYKESRDGSRGNSSSLPSFS